MRSGGVTAVLVVALLACAAAYESYDTSRYSGQGWGSEHGDHMPTHYTYIGSSRWTHDSPWLGAATPEPETEKKPHKKHKRAKQQEEEVPEASPVAHTYIPDVPAASKRGEYTTPKPQTEYGYPGYSPAAGTETETTTTEKKWHRKQSHKKKSRSSTSTEEASSESGGKTTVITEPSPSTKPEAEPEPSPAASKEEGGAPSYPGSAQHWTSTSPVPGGYKREKKWHKKSARKKTYYESSSHEESASESGGSETTTTTVTVEPSPVEAEPEPSPVATEEEGTEYSHAGKHWSGGPPRRGYTSERKWRKSGAHKKTSHHISTEEETSTESGISETTTVIASPMPSPVPSVPEPIHETHHSQEETTTEAPAETTTTHKRRHRGHGHKKATTTEASHGGLQTLPELPVASVVQEKATQEDYPEPTEDYPGGEVDYPEPKHDYPEPKADYPGIEADYPGAKEDYPVIEEVAEPKGDYSEPYAYQGASELELLAEEPAMVSDEPPVSYLYDMGPPLASYADVVSAWAPSPDDSLEEDYLEELEVPSYPVVPDEPELSPVVPPYLPVTLAPQPLPEMYWLPETSPEVTYEEYVPWAPPIDEYEVPASAYEASVEAPASAYEASVEAPASYEASVEAPASGYWVPASAPAYAYEASVEAPASYEASVEAPASGYWVPASAPAYAYEASVEAPASAYEVPASASAPGYWVPASAPAYAYEASVEAPASAYEVPASASAPGYWVPIPAPAYDYEVPVPEPSEAEVPAPEPTVPLPEVVIEPPPIKQPEPPHRPHHKKKEQAPEKKTETGVSKKTPPPEEETGEHCGRGGLCSCDCAHATSPSCHCYQTLPKRKFPSYRRPEYSPYPHHKGEYSTKKTEETEKHTHKRKEEKSVVKLHTFSPQRSPELVVHEPGLAHGKPAKRKEWDVPQREYPGHGAVKYPEYTKVAVPAPAVIEIPTYGYPQPRYRSSYPQHVYGPATRVKMHCVPPSVCEEEGKPKKHQKAKGHSAVEVVASPHPSPAVAHVVSEHEASAKTTESQVAKKAEDVTVKKESKKCRKCRKCKRCGPCTEDSNGCAVYAATN